MEQTVMRPQMEAELNQIDSELSSFEINDSAHETEYDSDTSSEQTASAESSVDDEDSDYGLNRREEPLPHPNCTETTTFEAKNKSFEDSDSSDGEDSSSASIPDTLTMTSAEIQESETDSNAVTTDRGGGDADQQCDTDVFTMVDDGTSCATLKVKIIAKKRQYDPEAYEKWIIAKNEEIRRNRQKQKQQAQRLEEEKRYQEKMRKDMNHEKVQHWMQRKTQDTCSSTKPASNGQEFVQNDGNARFKVWLEKVKKREEEKRAEEMVRKQQETQKRDDRKKASQVSYSKWLKSSRNKTLPVPLNQGPHTLRGSVSKMFVNPKPWKSNCD